MSEKYNFGYVNGQYRIYAENIYVATVHTESAASTLVAELNSVQQNLEAAHARVEALEARATNLHDAIRQHLIVWNNIKDANRTDNTVLVATDTQDAMLSMLDSIDGDFSMVMIGDAFNTLESVIKGGDSYYIKLYKEVLAERAESLQAENERLQQELDDSKE